MASSSSPWCSSKSLGSSFPSGSENSMSSSSELGVALAATYELRGCSSSLKHSYRRQCRPLCNNDINQTMPRLELPFLCSQPSLYFAFVVLLVAYCPPVLSSSCDWNFSPRSLTLRSSRCSLHNQALLKITHYSTSTNLRGWSRVRFRSLLD